MCQSAAEGVIDFSRADPRDRYWWMRLLLLTDQVAARNRITIHKLHYQMTTALLSRPELSATSAEKLNENATSIVADINQQLFPWITQDRTSQLQKEGDQLRVQWAKVWGDPDDPAVQAKIAATVATMKRQLERSQQRRSKWTR